MGCENRASSDKMSELTVLSISFCRSAGVLQADKGGAQLRNPSIEVSFCQVHRARFSLKAKG